VTSPDRKADLPSQLGEIILAAKELSWKQQDQGLELNAWVLAVKQVYITLFSFLTEICPPAEAPERPRENRGTNIQMPSILIVLLIVGIWVLMALLIHPRGEFPLNDDWTYSRTVKTLLEGGGLKFPEISTNIIARSTGEPSFAFHSVFHLQRLEFQP
jgi:hypothetical protein